MEIKNLDSIIVLLEAITDTLKLERINQNTQPVETTQSEVYRRIVIDPIPPRGYEEEQN